jgi:hypothetical protein
MEANVPQQLTMAAFADTGRCSLVLLADALFFTRVLLFTIFKIKDSISFFHSLSIFQNYQPILLNTVILHSFV